MREKWLFGYLIKDTAHNPWVNVYVCHLQHPTYPDAAEDNRPEILKRLQDRLANSIVENKLFTATLELNVEVKKNTIVFTMSHMATVRSEILKLYQECAQEMHNLSFLENLGD